MGAFVTFQARIMVADVRRIRWIIIAGGTALALLGGRSLQG